MRVRNIFKMTENYLFKNPYSLLPLVDAPVYTIPGNYKSNDATWYNGLTEEEKKAHKAKIEKELGLSEGSLVYAEPLWEKIEENK